MVLRYGYRIPFLCKPPLTRVPISLPSYHPSSTKGEATWALVAKSAVELAPLLSLGFYSRLFVVWKTSGSWRPVIDLSILNLYVDVSHFRMETIQSVLLSVRQGDWMASIDLKEAYLQVPVHPDSRRFLRFVAQGNVYQFSALCFGLSTAPVSAILHSWGIRMRQYLDDWLVQSSSRESLLRDLSVVLDLCHELGIVVNPAKSHLVPSQIVQYPGVVVDSQSFRASPLPECVARLRSTAYAFLSCADPPASTWFSLLGILSSLSHLVPGGRLRVRSLQLCLHRSWDRGDQSVGIPWTPDCLRDLQWWLNLPCLSLWLKCLRIWTSGPMPQDVGWGAHLGSLTASGLWDYDQASLSINARELLAIREGLLHFRSSLFGKNVAVFCDNSTAVSYLRKEGGTRSPFLSSLAREILRWTESLSIRLLPQFIPGSLNVLADSLSRPHQLPHTEWSLHPEVFRSISRMWPVQLDLFATFANHQCSVFFSPFRDPLAAGTDAFLQRWDGLQAYAFPSWSVIPQVLAKLRVSPGTELTLIAPYWPQRAWFPDLLHLSLAPPVALPLHRDLLRLPQSHNLYQGLHRLRLHAWRLRCFTRAAGFSSAVASRLPCRKDHPRARLTSLSGGSTVPGATLTSILSPVRRCLRWQIFFAGSAPRRTWGFLPSGATAPCCLRFFGSNSLLFLLILCFGIFFALSALSRRNASFAPQLGTSPWF